MIKKIIYCCDFCKKEITDENKSEFAFNDWWFDFEDETHFGCCKECNETIFLETLFYVYKDDIGDYLLTTKNDEESYMESVGDMIGKFKLRDVDGLVEIRFLLDSYFLWDVPIQDDKMKKLLDKVIEKALY
jgi:hypothetical protein